MAATTEATDRDLHAEPHLGIWRRYRRRLGWNTYHWWHEVIIIAVGYAIYTIIRDTLHGQRSAAFRNAHQVIHTETILGIHHEQLLNTWVAPIPWLADACDYWYATSHFVVTIGVAVWIIWKHPRYARSLRLAWYSMNLYALLGFAFYPLAPPRFLPGSIDTIATYGIWGQAGKAANADGASNPFAAMPSMHIGWSTWCALVIAVIATRWWVKLLGIVYPLLTLLVVLATANHYLLDALGGLIALALGLLTSVVMTRHPPFTPEPQPPACERDARPYKSTVRSGAPGSVIRCRGGWAWCRLGRGGRSRRGS